MHNINNAIIFYTNKVYIYSSYMYKFDMFIIWKSWVICKYYTFTSILSGICKNINKMNIKIFVKITELDIDRLLFSVFT